MQPSNLRRSNSLRRQNDIGGRDLHEIDCAAAVSKQTKYLFVPNKRDECELAHGN